MSRRCAHFPVVGRFRGGALMAGKVTINPNGWRYVDISSNERPTISSVVTEAMKQFVKRVK